MPPRCNFQLLESRCGTHELCLILNVTILDVLVSRQRTMGSVPKAVYSALTLDMAAKLSSRLTRCQHHRRRRKASHCGHHRSFCVCPAPPSFSQIHIFYTFFKASSMLPHCSRSFAWSNRHQTMVWLQQKTASHSAAS